MRPGRDGSVLHDFIYKRRVRAWVSVGVGVGARERVVACATKATFFVRSMVPFTRSARAPASKKHGRGSLNSSADDSYGLRG